MNGRSSPRRPAFAPRLARLATATLLPLALGLSSGCARRFKLADVDLQQAKQAEALGALRVYPSNRTLTIYDESSMRTVTVSREIRERSRRERKPLILNRGTSGAIVGEDLLNGQRILWVTFSVKCATVECAYGFVQVEDGRYVLTHVPKREGFGPPRTHRSIMIKRHRMKKGYLRSLSDANQVYRLERKRRTPVVFLEVKRAKQERVTGQRERETGV